MDFNERIKAIDDFFSNLTVEEFEKIAIECGVNEIKPASSFGMELVSSYSSSYSSEGKYAVEKPMQIFKLDEKFVEAA